MKRTFCKLFIPGMLLVVAPNVWAASNYGMAGCGLGAVIFKDDPSKIQILAGTINNLISPQTSAITSGTSNCYEDSSRQEASLFITINQAALEKDISRGDGETLASLSKILKCSDSAKLGDTLQKDYSRIFPSSSASSIQVSQAIGQSIQSNGALAKTCKVTI